jgi:hypothetical protein
MLYSIIPLVLLTIFLDWSLDLGLIMRLPERPEYWSIWIYIFGMPHVFASFLLLADNAYWQEFKTKLIVSAAAMLAIPIVLTNFFGFDALFFFFTVLIIYHTVAQQFGLALIASQTKPDIYHKLNTFLGSGVGVVIYAVVYNEGKIDLISSTIPELEWLAWSLMIPVLWLSIKQYNRSKTTEGKQFVALNYLMLLTILIAFSYGLSVLAIILGRIIHEFCAWFIYSAHDQNRNATEAYNVVYRHLPFIAPKFAGLIIAFVVGVLVTYSLVDAKDLAFLLVSFSLYHYWIEGFIWKGNSGPKQHVKFQ